MGWLRDGRGSYRVGTCRPGGIARVDTAATADGWGEPGEGWGGFTEPHAGNEAVQTASLRYLNRDTKAVTATLRAHGIRFPEFL